MRLLLGPVAVVTPYAVAWLARSRVSAGALTLAAVAFFLILRLRVDVEPARGFSRARAVDWWFFNLSLYLPLILFMTRLDLRVGGVVYPVALATCVVAVCGYISWYVLLWWVGAAAHSGKFLYGLAVVPLHMATFASLATFGPGLQLIAAGIVGVVMEHYYWRLGGPSARRLL